MRPRYNEKLVNPQQVSSRRGGAFCQMSTVDLLADWIGDSHCGKPTFLVFAALPMLDTVPKHLLSIQKQQAMPHDLFFFFGAASCQNDIREQRVIFTYKNCRTGLIELVMFEGHRRVALIQLPKKRSHCYSQPHKTIPVNTTIVKRVKHLANSVPIVKNFLSYSRLRHSF